MYDNSTTITKNQTLACRMRGLEVGGSLYVKIKDYSRESVRSIAHFLKGKGYKFSVSGAGMKDRSKVTRMS